MDIKVGVPDAIVDEMARVGRCKVVGISLLDLRRDRTRSMRPISRDPQSGVRNR
jgi:hypothetical protein